MVVNEWLLIRSPETNADASIISAGTNAYQNPFE